MAKPSISKSGSSQIMRVGHTGGTLYGTNPNSTVPTQQTKTDLKLGK